MYFEHQVALITGGAKGIGKASAEVFVREGAKVIVLDNDEDAGQQLQQALGEKLLFISVDVSQAEQVKSAIDKAVQHMGRLDFLVNNAGIIRYANAQTCDEDEWDLVMNVNLKSYFLCAKYALPYLQKAGEAMIVNVASAQSFISSANMVHYTTAKTALLGFTRSLAIDFTPNIRALAICPGTVDTPMARNAWATATDPKQIEKDSEDMHVLKRIAQPEEVAEMIVFCCTNRCGFMTGTAIRVDGGLGIAVPGSVND